MFNYSIFRPGRLSTVTGEKLRVKERLRAHTLDFGLRPMKTTLSQPRNISKATKHNGDLRPHSSIVLDGPERAAARSMLYPIGFKPEDFSKPIIGIASTWSNVTPCNM